MPESSDPFSIKPNEWWAALAIFLIPALTAFLVEVESTAEMPDWGPMMVIIFLGSAIVPLIWAIFKGFPHWSPPYLGVLLVGFVVFVPFWRLVELIYPALIPWIGSMQTWSLPVHILYQVMLSTIIWLLVLLAAFALISLLRLWPHTRTLWKHIHEDWTQLSFILYGGLVFHIVMIFDEYQGDGPWKVAAWLCLGIGCWFYLRARNQKQRLIILLTGATLAMWIVAVGKWGLVPSQNWGGGFARLPATDTDRWFETVRTIADWLILMAALLIPSLLNLFPQTQEATPQADSGLAGVS